MSEKFEMVAKTFQGLEGVLADELRDLGADDVEVGRRMVSFKGDKFMMYKANFCCRTALRILKPFYTFKATDADQLYDQVKKFNWESVFLVNQTFSIDSTVNSDEFRHSKFVTYRVKDAIVDYFTEKFGKRPSIRIQNSDVMFNVHISGENVILSLDSSGESLHKRGYRVGQTEAPINEVLAAGLIKLTGWDGNCDLIDPMCGSGTFLIEAALIGANIYPGIYRNGFAFERWNDFDADLFESIYNDDSKEREFKFKIYGSDISPKAIDIADKNIKNARVGKYIETEILPFQNIGEAPKGGMLISNPPYGERLSMDDMESFYKSIGDKLKEVFKGYQAWLIGPATDLFGLIGLKPSLKYPILNGSLECELREYVIFEGRYNDFVKEGNTVKNDSFKRPEAAPKRPSRDRDRGDRRDHKFGDRKFGDRDRKFGDRDRKFGDRDRKFGDRDRKFGDRDDRKFGDRDRKFGDRDDRKFGDRDDRKFGDRGDRKFGDRGDRKFGDDRRERRDIKPYGHRPEASDPRNPLEEHYSRPFRTRRDGDAGEGVRPEKIHGDEIAEKIVRYRKPTLGKESERPVIRGRRNGWKRAGVAGDVIEHKNEDETSNNED